jgi:AraC-like DNA-binding protein
VLLTFEDRPSDSPYIERVWRGFSSGGGPFLSIAAGHLEIVVTRLPDFTMVSVRGPETRATTIDCPPNGEWDAIRFRPGVHLPSVPTDLLLDHRDIHLPVADDGSFVLAGYRWQMPDLENAEGYVARLADRGVIARDDVVEAALQRSGQPPTIRSVQRHFRRTTGMTHGLFRQIERARLATNLLRTGAPILDAVHEAGYFDQAHLTRSFKTLVGQTPSSVARQEAQLSFLYKTGASSSG